MIVLIFVSKKHVDIFKKLFNVEEFIWTVSCLRNWRFLFCISMYKYWCFIFGYYFRKILIEILKYIIDYKIRSTYFHRRRKISSQRTESKIIYIYLENSLDSTCVIPHQRAYCKPYCKPWNTIVRSAVKLNKRLGISST